jgi:hypothetical protein
MLCHSLWTTDNCHVLETAAYHWFGKMQLQ